MFGKYDNSEKLIPVEIELVRHAIPRRVYIQSHRLCWGSSHRNKKG